MKASEYIFEDECLAEEFVCEVGNVSVEDLAWFVISPEFLMKGFFINWLLFHPTNEFFIYGLPRRPRRVIKIF